MLYLFVLFFYGGIGIIQMLLDRSVMMLKENHETLFSLSCVSVRELHITPLDLIKVNLFRPGVSDFVAYVHIVASFSIYMSCISLFKQL